MKQISRGAAFLLLCLGLASGVPAQDEHVAALPDGDGKDIVSFACTQCHTLRETVMLRDGQKGWQDTVNRMVLYGAQLSPAEADRAVRYLATGLGPIQASAAVEASAPDASPRHHHMNISLPEGQGRELVAAHCALCHGLEKVVSVKRSPADWVAITDNMEQRGMNAAPDETQTIVHYLQANFSANSPAAPGPQTAQPPAARAGQAVFTQRCFQCHSVLPGQVLFGPSLYGELKPPHPKKTPAQVRVILRDGKGKMPSFKDILSKQDVDDLIAYLSTL